MTPELATGNFGGGGGPGCNSKRGSCSLDSGDSSAEVLRKDAGWRKSLLQIATEYMPSECDRRANKVQ